MKTYYVFWTYLGNFATAPIKVRTTGGSADAIDAATAFFSQDFHDKAMVMVFEAPPVAVRVGLKNTERQKIALRFEDLGVEVSS